jgi:multicomponent Na+:H+ antiporter subunit E
MTRHGVALLWLTAAWGAFQRELSVANLLVGLLLGAALLAIFPYGPPSPGLRFNVVPLLKFSVVFAWSVVKANAIVAWEVITPRNRINEGIVAVPLESKHPIVITMVSHAIILAPGTMVIEIDRDPETILFVHALHLRSVEAVRREVLQLERLALQAFGGATADQVEEATP